MIIHSYFSLPEGFDFSSEYAHIRENKLCLEILERLKGTACVLKHCAYFAGRLAEAWAVPSRNILHC